MSYSTEDCKKYLVTIYRDTVETGWKRIKKYNDNEKRIARDFEYKDGRKATIVETSEGLKDKTLLGNTNNVNNSNNININNTTTNTNPFEKIRQKNPQNHDSGKNTNPEEEFKKFMGKVLGQVYPEQDKQPVSAPTSSIEMMKEYLKQQEQSKNTANDMDELNAMFAHMPSIIQKGILDHDNPLDQLVRTKRNIVTDLFEGVDFSELDTNEEKFLYVLVNGTQWDQEDGNRASTDFYDKIENKEEFFTNLTAKSVNVPDMYISLILNTASMIESMDEGYVPFHVMDGPEAIKDMCVILTDMVNIIEKHSSKVQLDKDLLEGCIYTLESVKDHCSMGEAGDMWTREEVDNEIDKLSNFIKSKLPKKGLKL